MHIDTNLDGGPDYYYLVQRPQWFASLGRHYDGTYVEMSRRLFRALTALRIDYRLPWPVIGSPERLNLGFLVRPMNENVILDQLDLPGYWLTVSQSALPRVRNDLDFRHRVHLPLVLCRFP